MRLLTWNDFDACVLNITHSCRHKKFRGVYGFPRGGLCLAVAVSHSMRIPFLYEPMPDSLVVDDIYETGATLNKVRELPGISTFVWISKVVPDWWNAVEVNDSKDWIVFPWEDHQFAEQDERSYLMMRSKLSYPNYSQDISS
ncbi:phosphoribosyltransferase [Prochlorococcus marinus]|uniref:phosphoribosyltransferase n=1 Tax=Prochlorococcus marinus TaxID=1219 RepID=UPI0022B46B55|nr:phosphoribosyltransferase [Prochlorococcus marinus]